MGRKPKKRVQPLAVLECVRCGQEKPENEFCHNKWSKVYNRKRVPLCMDCIQMLFDENKYQFGEKMALYLTCAVLDVPYASERYEKIIETTPPFTLGKYIRQIQINQYKNSSFAESVADGDIPTADNTGGKHYATTERVNIIRAEITALREEMRNLKVKLAGSGNAHE